MKHQRGDCPFLGAPVLRVHDFLFPVLRVHTCASCRRFSVLESNFLKVPKSHTCSRRKQTNKRPLSGNRLNRGLLNKWRKKQKEALNGRRCHARRCHARIHDGMPEDVMREFMPPDVMTRRWRKQTVDLSTDASANQRTFPPNQGMLWGGI